MTRTTRTGDIVPAYRLTKLSDVVSLANVSLATASHAASSLVSDDTRARVQAAIKELRRIPHGAAKTLASVRTRTVGNTVSAIRFAG